MKTEESNRLIAEFMGSKPYQDDRYGEMWPDPTNGNKVGFGLKYHTSWDWLMPVVEKIEKTRVNGFMETGIDDKAHVEWRFSVEIRDCQCLINRDVLPQYYGTENDFLNLYDCRKVSKIDSVYQAVVAFIEFYTLTK